MKPYIVWYIMSKSKEKPTILFVDDELNILNSIRRGLFKGNYKTLFALDGNEALNILEKKDIHVIVSDMRMPGMSGLDLLTIVNENYPDIVKIILTGNAKQSQLSANINKIGIFKIINKPFRIDDELIPTLREAVEYYNSKLILEAY